MWEKLGRPDITESIVEDEGETEGCEVAGSDLMLRLDRGTPVVEGPAGILLFGALFSLRLSGVSESDSVSLLYSIKSGSLSQTKIS